MSGHSYRKKNYLSSTAWTGLNNPYLMQLERMMVISAMGLCQLLMVLLVPDDSLLRFLLIMKTFPFFNMGHFPSKIRAAIQRCVYI